VFAHGHLLRVLTARWLAQPPSCGALYRLDTAGLSVLGWEREQPVLVLWNRPA
jgi:probable phosphoglycerate mutase